jgi:hypothetical protein
MKAFNPKLLVEIGKLMDFEATLLNAKMANLNVPKNGYLEDGFIYSIFTKPFVEMFSCKVCRFPCFGLCVMDAEEEFLPVELVKFHTDGDNGVLSGNDISATLSIFFAAKLYMTHLKKKDIVMKRQNRKAICYCVGQRTSSALNDST